MENRLFQIHHKIYLKLNAICQEAGDMDVEEFLKVYEELSFVDNKAHVAEIQTDEIMELKKSNKLAHERIKELERQVAKYDFLD